MNLFNWRKLQKNIQPSTSRPRLAFLVLGVFALLALTWLGINTQTVVVGQRVRELEAKLDRVNHENAKLEYDIAVQSQPKRIAERASALGLRPATRTQTTYLNVNYTANVVAQEKPRVDGHSFDWVAWLDDVLNRLGLGVNTHAAEASQ